MESVRRNISRCKYVCVHRRNGLHFIPLSFEALHQSKPVALFFVKTIGEEIVSRKRQSISKYLYPKKVRPNGVWAKLL